MYKTVEVDVEISADEAVEDIGVEAIETALRKARGNALPDTSPLDALKECIPYLRRSGTDLPLLLRDKIYELTGKIV